MSLVGALQFEIDPESYSSGRHTYTVAATNQNGETEEYTITFGKISFIIAKSYYSIYS